jgi:hypothetical protein
MFMRAKLVVLSLVALCVVPALCSGDPPPDQTRLRTLEQSYGPSHPKVLAVKAQIVDQAEPAFNGLVVVLTRNADAAFTLGEMRALSFGGRQFLVGKDVKSDYTMGKFVGKRVWVPIEDVTQMVELGDAKPAGR